MCCFVDTIHVINQTSGFRFVHISVGANTHNSSPLILGPCCRTNVNHINFYLGHGIISLLGNPECFVTCRDGGVFLLTKTSALNSLEFSLALVIWWAWFVTASVKPYEPGLILLAAAFSFFIFPPFFLGWLWRQAYSLTTSVGHCPHKAEGEGGTVGIWTVSLAAEPQPLG